MIISEQLAVAATTWPVDLPELKDHCIIHRDFAEDDLLLTSYLKAATRAAETATGRALTTQSWRLSFNDPWEDSRLYLPHPPLQSVTSIVRVESGGGEVPIGTEYWDAITDFEPGMLVLKSGYVHWPYTTTTLYFKATYVAGYASTDLIPDDILQGIKLTVAAWYGNRENVITGTIVNTIPMGAQDLWAAHAVNWAEL